MMVTGVVAVTDFTVVSRTMVKVSFADGVTRVLDLRPLMRGSLFDEVFRKKQFDTIHVDAVAGTLAWSNGAKLDPYVLRFRSGGYANRHPNT